MQQLRTVRLYGVLGSKFGRTFRLALDTQAPAEAIAALSAQLKGFREFMLKAKDRGLGFSVFVGKRNLKEEQLNDPSGAEDIRIAPILLGSKNGGVFNVILGVVLVAIAYFNPFNLLTGPMISSMYGIGSSMIMGGVVQLLSPQPKGLKLSDRPDNQPSYVFNGPVNTQAQGNPVPVLYGRLIVGSAVVSAGIHAEDYAPATAGVGSGVNLNGHVLKNFYERQA
ncbi:tail assembly protein [Dyella sp. LX-66]|uniref:tail assembly protein n=1 Tax=unclassified Dyella TaxID=2634549 RepID=UPI001BE0C0D4|nr:MULTISPECIES: tail assembly protein [unclassified Dyella]MBT2116412.1 tail assembly protein [Dyella sp. LX-1]MBT2140645.1 tail assembly protein [Dyella sp. LX-66]